MVIWQLARNYATFAVYCVFYGLTAGGFVSLLPTTTADIVGVENIQKGLGMAYLMTVIGSLLGSPVIGLLYSSYGWTAAIQFAGSMTFVGSLFVLVLRLMISGSIFYKV
jgi:predicted MFS family arabinose efflux permease